MGESGAAALGRAFVDGIVIEPVFAALAFFLLAAFFLFFALFAAVAHGNLFSFSLKEVAGFCSTPNVPRGTIFAEWRRFGEVCWMCFIFNGMELHNLWAICAWLQRMGFGCSLENQATRTRDLTLQKWYIIGERDHVDR